MDGRDPFLGLFRRSPSIAHPHLLLAVDGETPEALPREGRSGRVARFVADHDDLVPARVVYNLHLVAGPHTG
ncbi:MAG: hypothetical protein KDB15_16670, partial [Microthrixaceae bacterium]|nr:hypothetical protein [Microthrixaceae bacterium]